MDTELEALCNALTEAERAGGKVLAELAAGADAPYLRSLLEKLAHDEGYWAGALAALLRRRGCTPSAKTGDFVEKVRAVDGMTGKLELLNRGQRWVIRKIEESGAGTRDDELAGFLAAMADAHRTNIELVERVLVQGRASRSA